MFLAFAVLTGLLMVLDWASVLTGRRAVERWAKPLAMASMIAAALAHGDLGLQHGAGRWLVVALLFGLLGDVALLGRTAARFVSGVAAFLIGHLAYIACFLALGLPSPAWAWVVAALLLGMLVVTRDVAPSAYRLGGLGVAVPIAAYSLVIAGMLATAWLTGSWPIAIGAAIFVVSDSIIGLSLARTGFAGPSSRTHVAVMVTYHVGQALITGGVLHALTPR